MVSLWPSHRVVPAPSYDVGIADVSGRARQESVRATKELINILDVTVR